MILRENLTLKYFRLIYFPLHFIFEIALLVLFLILPFYDVRKGILVVGYASVFGTILASTSFILAVGISYLFISSFHFKKERAHFLSDERSLKIVITGTIFLLLARIGILASSFLYQIPFSFDRTAAILLLIGASTLAPFMLYYLSNFEVSPTRIFSLSKDAPLTIKIAMIWLVFLTGAMQIFSTQLVILIISLVILVTSYFFFILNRLAVSLTSIILIIHSAFSFLFAGVVFANMEAQITTFNEQGFDYSRIDVILVNVFFFLVPGIFSLIIAGNFFRKSVTGWIRMLYLEDEMDIANYYDEEDEDVDD